MVGLCWTSGQGTTPDVATKPIFFVFLCVCLSALAWPRHSCHLSFLSSALQTSRCRFATMLPDSFASLSDLSPLLVLEGLHHNLTAIRTTPPPPAESSSHGRASAWAQDMVEVLLLKFLGQSSGKLICFYCCILLVGTTGCWGMLMPCHAQRSWLVEHYPCSSTLLVDWMYSKYYS